MIDYFKAGGFTMWFTLFTALASLAVAVAKGGEDRSRTLWLGSYGSLLFGVFGMAAGMVAVARNVGRFDDKASAIAEGLGELSSNGSFGASLALALAIAALVTRVRTTATTTA